MVAPLIAAGITGAAAIGSTLIDQANRRQAEEDLERRMREAQEQREQAARQEADRAQRQFVGLSQASPAGAPNLGLRQALQAGAQVRGDMGARLAAERAALTERTGQQLTSMQLERGQALGRDILGGATATLQAGVAADAMNTQESLAQQALSQQAPEQAALQQALAAQAAQEQGAGLGLPPPTAGANLVAPALIPAQAAQGATIPLGSVAAMSPAAQQFRLVPALGAPQAPQGPSLGVPQFQLDPELLRMMGSF